MNAKPGRYRGRFAPSPSGPLHAGSALAAVASWLDARAHQGHWLVRIEDIDTPRCRPGTDTLILHQLAALGLWSDEDVVWQSLRTAHYAAALDRLLDQGQVYPCRCSRRDITRAHQSTAAVPLRPDAPRHPLYPGTCRPECTPHPANTRSCRAASASDRPPPAIAYRLNTQAAKDPAAVIIDWQDRRFGPRTQHITHEVGDFVLRRKDGLWAYQLAVVVDDALQGITHIVRGEDLVDCTGPQIFLQRQLGAATPRYLHTPLVRDAQGRKLSKHHGAPSIDTTQPLRVLEAVGQALGLPGTRHCTTVGDWLAHALTAWAAQYGQDHTAAQTDIKCVR